MCMYAGLLLTAPEPRAWLVDIVSQVLRLVLLHTDTRRWNTRSGVRWNFGSEAVPPETLSREYQDVTTPGKPRTAVARLFNPSQKAILTGPLRC